MKEDKRTLAIDIETYSSEDLLKVGVYRYAESPDFQILLLAYAFDDDPVRGLDLTTLTGADNAEYRKVLQAIEDPTIIKTAHNAQFERVCLTKHLSTALDPDEWECTAVLSSIMGLPRGLADVAKAIGLPEDQQKQTTGKALIRYFSKPCAPTKKNGQRTRNLPHHDPERWELYKAYNIQDVEAERAVRRKLTAAAKSAHVDTEHELWCVDQRINDRGILTDRALVQNAIKASDMIHYRVKAEVASLTGIDNPSSVNQLKAWLFQADGLEIESLNKQSVPEIIAQTDNETVKRVLELRGEIAKASVKKYEAIDRAVSDDGRLRGTLMFYGARTGRWAGRVFQPQNLPQNKLPDLALARELVRAGEFEAVEILFGNISGTLSQLVRTALIPKPGARFLVADFSAIEARVIAWMAGERWRMDVFNSHGKIYEASASQMFKVPLETIAKGQENYALRAKGKVAELALGYGGATGALKAMGALDMGLEEAELPGLVRAWRKTSPKITDFWWAVGDAAIAATDTGRPQQTHGLTFEKKHGFLFIRLPSGRKLAYFKPRIETGQRGQPQLIYDGVDQKKKRYGPLDTYGPRLVENIVQAISRDLLAHGIMNLERAGYQVCLHVHDEVITETKTGTLAEAIKLLTDAPTWAKGLPLQADGFECDFYKKD